MNQMMRKPKERSFSMNEEEKMKQGQWYDANDEELCRQRMHAKDLCFLLNQCLPSDLEKRNALMKELLPHAQERVEILSPFYTDYGHLCRIGRDTFINHNAYFMDGGTITIGAHCFIGPNCAIYTALHPLDKTRRDQGLEQTKPIVIQDHVWLGGDVTILPGVTIGEGCVIGAKSVVTKSLPPYVLAYGNPCRIISAIEKEEDDKAKQITPF